MNLSILGLRVCVHVHVHVCTEYTSEHKTLGGETRRKIHSHLVSTRAPVVWLPKLNQPRVSVSDR